MASYRQLAARFHSSPDELAERRAAIEAKRNALDRDDAELISLDRPLAAAWDAVNEAAEVLSRGRSKTAKDFARTIQSRLKPLGLGGARLSVAVETSELGADPTSGAAPESGADRVEILFSANPGEEPRPLRKIASGGELSRLTLAVKSVLAAVDRVPTLVFDEIDAGVGGRLGSALGKTLAALARHHQVICVTHLPQMASYAARHWVIRKQIERGRSRTTITPLDEAERIDELAAMLRGESAAEGTRQEAMAMLMEAQAMR
jgi:DNA repair protein RecN (Recombination protein N)